MADDLLAAQICLRDAWPSFDTADLGGWRLRAGLGGYNRINSVWPGRFTGEVTVEDAIARAETFYRERGLRPRFQMLDIAGPAGLDALLAARGYQRELDCTDMAKAVAPAAMPDGCTVSTTPPDDWVALYRAEQPPEKAAEFPRIFPLLPKVSGFVVCRRGATADAVALVGRIGDDVAVDCVLTQPGARRTGAARSVMLAAEAWAAGQGARRLLLSVVNDNAAAMPLYLDLGYRKLSGYYYRFKAAE